MAVEIKKREDIEKMREAARINVEVLQAMYDAVRPGITTRQLDKIAADILAKRGAIAAFLGHPKGSRHPFPATITACVNSELVHGIPSNRRLEEGDLVSLDCGTIYKGFVADSAFSRGVGKIQPDVQRLIDVTDQSLYVGIDACVANNHIGDIGFAIQTFVESSGFHVVREYGGHGVGRKMWEEPHIPNHGNPGKGVKLKERMTLALEPMVMPGDPATKMLNDHWTVVMADGGLCAHCEHTVVISDNGPEILTKWD